jgi:hypothetical protein
MRHDWTSVAATHHCAFWSSVGWPIQAGPRKGFRALPVIQAGAARDFFYAYAKLSSAKASRSWERAVIPSLGKMRYMWD